MEEQRGAASVGNAGRAMGKLPGAIVGVSADDPAHDVEFFDSSGSRHRGGSAQTHERKQARKMLHRTLSPKPANASRTEEGVASKETGLRQNRCTWAPCPMPNGKAVRRPGRWAQSCPLAIVCPFAIDTSLPLDEARAARMRVRGADSKPSKCSMVRSSPSI